MRNTGLFLLVVVVTLLGTPAHTDPPSPIITTVAGGGPESVDIATVFLYPGAIFVDPSGSLFITEYSRIFRLDPGGQVAVVAGSGAAFYTGDAVPATYAALHNVDGHVVRDAAGNLFIADTGNHRIRRVDAATGYIETIAGTGVMTGEFDQPWGGDPADDLGDGGPATAATLRSPTSLVLDPQGNLVISDTSNHRIRRVDSATGIISTIAGTGGFGLDFPREILYDAAGNLLIADTGNSVIRRIGPVDVGQGPVLIMTTVAGSGTPTGVYDGEGGNPADDLGDGGPATNATLRYPVGISLDSLGRLLITDTENYRIRRVDHAGIITTVAGNGWYPGNIDGRGPILEGVPATVATLYSPADAIEDPSGNLIIADYANARLRRVDGETGIITSISGDSQIDVGDGGPATSAFTNAFDVAADQAGNFFIADARSVRRVDKATGIITTVAGCDPVGRCSFGEYPSWSHGAPRALATDASGNLFIGWWDRILRMDASTGFVAFFRGINVGSPRALSFDAQGNLYILRRNDYDGSSPTVVRRVDMTTQISTTVAGGGDDQGDGGLAVEAHLQDATGLAVDPAGNIYISDGNRIRRVDAVTGIIETAAGSEDAGFDGDGGAATSALLSRPRGLDIDSDGNLLIADSFNNRVRKVDLASGIITTVAGDGHYGLKGDGRQATHARLGRPLDVAALTDGSLLIADTSNTRVRLVFPETAARGRAAPVSGADERRGQRPAGRKSGDTRRQSSGSRIP